MICLSGSRIPFHFGRSFCFCRAKEECCRHIGCDFSVGFTTRRRGTGHLQFKSFAFLRFRKSWSLKRYQADLELSEEKELKDTVTFVHRAAISIALVAWSSRSGKLRTQRKRSCTMSCVAFNSCHVLRVRYLGVVQRRLEDLN